MILVSWNCRGMGSSLKSNAVCDLLKSEHPDFLLLQETKITDQDFQNNVKRSRSYEGIGMSAVGASGGIGTIWDKSKWKLKDSRQSKWWLRTDMQNTSKSEEYTIYNVYAPPHYRDKASCWESITSDLISAQDRKIFLGGDLNLIRNAEEKMGGNFLADPSRDALENIIQTHSLVDIPPQNGRFTWSNKRTGKNNIKERLDRIMVQEGIMANCSRIQSTILQGYISDHKPVAIHLVKGENMGPIPFKYNRAWDNSDEFRNLVKEKWATEITGSPHYIWETKIKILRAAIKQWARDFAAEKEKRKIDLQRKLTEWNQEKEKAQDTEEDLKKENELYMELYKQNRAEEEEQRQKSRCLWLKSGDKNTSFFHNSIKLRRAGNNIGKIAVEGSELTEQREIKEAATRHFQNLLSADPHYIGNPDFLKIIENKITGEQNAELEKEIMKEEIEWSIQSMPMDKAPGPDGFTVAFYRTHWEVIKKDYIRMAKNFFAKCKLGSSIKASHLALIPKDPNPQSFDRFRPISLCNVSYKIISKILAHRIKKILPYLVSENQGGFIPRRHITDNVILIQEAIHSSLSRKEKGMLVKLDMANAFDRVNHSFLQAVLMKFGISEFFVSRLMECISHIWTSPLINGRPCIAFKSSRGLRQGCPLSPFLYVIMAETLSLHLEHKRKTKEITGVDIIRGTKGINHSLFADDTLLIGGASSIMARRFKKILDLFLQASGGKLNNNKCMIYTWNVPRNITQRISIIMEIPGQGNWSHLMYLGLPLAKETIKSEIWVKLIEKLRGKLQSWGVHWLNLAGRTILIKAILTALPIYQFATTLAPAGIHKHMELIIRSFIWQGGKQDTKKFSLVKWDKVTLPLEKGGLGIRTPRLANMAMGFKLVWRILKEKGTWWTEVIKRKYLNGTKCSILSANIIERQCTPVWKLIKKTLPHFKSCISRAPGNGKEINIWEDRIMGKDERMMQVNFRPLQRWMAEAKIKTLYDISLWDQNCWTGWRPLPLPDDLKNLWAELKISLTGSAPTNRMKEDSFVWDPNGGNYTVKEGYKVLQNASATNNWPLQKAIWRTECLPKVKLFNWTLLHGRILTAENLRKKGIQGPSICCMCKEAEESIPHLFIECPFARACWNLIIKPLSISDPHNQITLLQKLWGTSFPLSNCKGLVKRVWNSIPANLCWQIWIARNKCIFKDKKPSISSVLAKTIAFINETIEANGINQAAPDLTDTRVKEWISKFNLEGRIQKLGNIGRRITDWKLRGSKDEVKSWIQNQNRPSLHFDGASRSNPGQAGAGGVIKDCQGRNIVSYEWGMGIMTNNKAEAYSLLLGTSIARKIGLRNLLILGDSAIIITAMTSGKDFNQAALNNIKGRIRENTKFLGNVIFKHILRANNEEADKQANKATRRKIGQVKENETVYEQDIP